MDRALHTLEIVEQLSGTNDKIKMLKENSNDVQLQTIINAALNFKYKFFIKKFDVPTPTGQEDVSNFVDFMSLITQLKARAITGNQAKEQVETFLASCSPVEQKWYSRVLKKDLRCGINISTAKNAGFDIPEFTVQLAKDGKKCKKVKDILAKGAFTSPKLDGYRCVAVIENGECKLYSRNGTEYTNFPSIAESLLSAFYNEEHNSKYVFDGEIMSNDFNSMQQSAFASVRGTTVGDVTYHIFDIIPFDEWESDNFITNAEKRYTALGILFEMARLRIEQLNITNLKEVQHAKVTTEAEIFEQEKQYIEQGFEGVMLNPNIPYYRGKKSNKMLKFKTMFSMDCKVVGIYEGEAGKKYEGTLGGLTVEQENGIVCDCGSGFSDSERAWIWANKDKTIGRIVECKYQELTPDGKMRFPIKKRWREDKQ